MEAINLLINHSNSAITGEMMIELVADKLTTSNIQELRCIISSLCIVLPSQITAQTILRIQSELGEICMSSQTLSS